MIRLVVFHLIGNALLLWLGYYWLGLGESSNGYLAYSAGVILLFTLGALWLHGTALAYFKQQKIMAVRNVVPLFVLALLVVAVYSALGYADKSFGHDAFLIGSYTTMKLRRPVAPSGVLRGFHMLIWLMRWLVVPVLAIPLAAEIANHGWSGFGKRALQMTRRPVFWARSLALLLMALWVPLKLFFWIPQVNGFPLEMASFAVRVALGYLLFVTSLLTLEFFTAKRLVR